MINEYSVSPKPSNRKAIYVSFLSFAITVVLVALYSSIELYRGIVGVFALIFLTVGIFIFTKYIGPKMYYEIMIDSDGVPLLIVRDVIGKRGTTYSRVELHTIVSAEKLEGDSLKRFKCKEGFTKFTYSPTFMPDSLYCFNIVSRYEKAHVLLEVSDEFASLLMKYAEEAKSMVIDDAE